MATLKISSRVEHSTDQIGIGGVSISATTVGNHKQLAEPTVGTSEETIAIAADITGGNGPGYCQIRNQDATNYVQVGISTGAYFARVLGGLEGVIPLDPGVTTLYVKANAAPCRLRVFICEA